MAIIPAGPQALSDNDFLETVNQVAHGFSQGDVVYFDDGSGDWVGAVATSAAAAGNGQRLAVVQTVTDVDNIVVRDGGVYTKNPHGFTVGKVVYLSAANSQMTTTAPSTVGQIVLQLGSVISSTEVRLDFDTGFVVEA